MRPIFCGNFEFDAHQSDVERLFKRYGKVDRVDMKSGFAFVYMDDDRDAEDAIRALDRREFGRKGRKLRVEWTKHERGSRKPQSSRKSADLRPSKTLFVINFPHHTRTKDLERHFDPYGKIANVRIRRNFAFVQYELQEDATRALDATNLSKLLEQIISVEYASQDDNKKRKDYSPDGRRGRDPSPYRSRRSPSPHREDRDSPDYGRGPSPAPNKRQRSSPNNGHRSRNSRSPHTMDRAGSPSSRKEKATRGTYGDRVSRSPSPSKGNVRSFSDGRARLRNPSREEINPNQDTRRNTVSPPPEEVDAHQLDHSASPRSVERFGEENSNGKQHSRASSLEQKEEGIIEEYDQVASPIGDGVSKESPADDSGNGVDGYESGSHSPANK